jgi:glycosyltransferase involved in cell wall biosynthesis
MIHGVSIILCCHNGARRLPETIKHIATQIVAANIPWEFLFIDNTSTDDSVTVAKQTWSQYSASGEFRIVKEPILGLSHARKKGFAEAQYEFMIMCDDDNWLAPDYVSNAYNIMSCRPNIGALGGRGKLLFEETPPKWIEYSQIFAAGEQSFTSGKVLRNRIYGAGAVIRRSAYLKLKELGFKSLLTDRKGDELSSGGDYELCYALAIAGYDIWYDSHLRFEHYITRERLTWNYFMRYARESSRCFHVLTPYKMIAARSKTQKFSFLVIAKDFMFTFREFLKITGRRFITDRGSVEGKLLYFRFVIHVNKLLEYFQKFRTIEKNHGTILKFKENCMQAVKTRQREYAAPSVKVTYASKLFRPLQ